MGTKKFLKNALILLLTFIIIFSMNSIVFAEGEGGGNFNFDDFNNKGDTSIKTPVRTVVGAVLSVIRIVGTGIAIIILAYIGMKYMIAAPGDRADFKKGAIQYVIGAIIVFGASNIMTFLVPVIERIVG